MQGVSVQGVSVQGVSVHGILYPGGLCPGGGNLCFQGVFVQRVSVQGGLCPGDTIAYNFVDAVCVEETATSCLHKGYGYLDGNLSCFHLWCYAGIRFHQGERNLC